MKDTESAQPLNIYYNGQFYVNVVSMQCWVSINFVEQGGSSQSLVCAY